MDGLPQFRFKRTRGLLVWGLVMGLSWTTEPKDKRSSYASRRRDGNSENLSRPHATPQREAQDCLRGVGVVEERGGSGHHRR
jgi:hypothetical protein